MPERVESLAGAIEPVLSTLGLELFDVELTGGGSTRTLRVIVDRDGGVDLDAITAATDAISPILDHHDDPALRGPYGLEVSSPGLERPLRRPQHYRRALGATVSVKTRGAGGEARRLRGVLVAADDDSLTIESEGDHEQVAYADVTQARTVFEWGSAPKSGKGPKRERGTEEDEEEEEEEGSGAVMNSEMMEALENIEREKGISIELMLEALANALVTAYKRLPTSAEEALVEIDVETGDIHVIAQELDEEGNVTREWDDTPKDFGRIAAQTAKQVILQRIREAEREMKYEEYAGREGDIVTGIIQQSDARYTLLDLGRVEALLPQAEQVQNERYDHGSRLKAYIVEVRKTAKGPQIVVSRTHPGLVKRLFELEVPEIVDGVVELKAIAREPGHRTKLAVSSNDHNVDPVGACVGARGSRVRMVVNELRGEKVDIVPYSDEPADFVQKALAPARVREVRIHPDTGTAEVIVPDFQLSLAIGKEGQNARLAARLTGWRVDIKSETQLQEEESGGGVEYAEGEWVQSDSGELVWQPAEGGEAISAAAAGYAAPDPTAAVVADAPADGDASSDGEKAAPEASEEKASEGKPSGDAPEEKAPEEEAQAPDEKVSEGAAEAPKTEEETAAAEPVAPEPVVEEEEQNAT